MKHRFSISEAARLTGLTSETLRHYDRIGLVQPGERDPATGYRYYTEQEIVRLNAVQALRCMDLSLREIGEVLSYDSLERIVGFLKQAEAAADTKIARLQYAKAKIAAARADYEKKPGSAAKEGAPFLRRLPERVILLSDTMREPTLSNLWNYHSHYFDQIAPERRALYAFEDLAGIYTAGEESRLFAVCIRCPDDEGLTRLPAGDYLCAACREENRGETLRALREETRRLSVEPPFLVQIVVLNGILQWHYELQAYLGKEGAQKSLR